MKKIYLFLLIGFFSSVSNAQENLMPLNSPSSPAASIIGLQPTAVLAPKSYKALEAALYSNFVQGNSVVLPNEFALEFTPYWTKNHEMPLEEYLFPKSISEQIKRTASISIASSNNYMLGDSSLTSVLGWGYRTTLHFSNEMDRKKVKNFTSKLNKGANIIVRITSKANSLAGDTSIKNRMDFKDKIRPVIIDTIVGYLGSKGYTKALEIANSIFKNYTSLPLYDPADPFVFIDAFVELAKLELANAEEELDAVKTFNEFEAYLKKRQGLLIDIAYAGFLNFPSNEFATSKLPQHSLWVTPTYQWIDEFADVKLMGVFRYQFYNIDYYKQYFSSAKVFQNNVDYGLAAAIEFKKVTLQLEAVGRMSNTEVPSGIFINGQELYSKDQNTDFQCIGTLNYKLTDNINFSYSLGDRFDPILNPGSTLVSLLALNFGVTNKK